MRWLGDYEECVFRISSIGGPFVQPVDLLGVLAHEFFSFSTQMDLHEVLDGADVFISGPGGFGDDGARLVKNVARVDALLLTMDQEHQGMGQHLNGDGLALQGIHRGECSRSSRR